MIYFFIILKIIIINTIKYIFRTFTYNEYIINILKELAELNITFAKIFQWSFIDKKKENKYITNEIYNFVVNYTTNAPYKSSDINYKKILQIYIESKKLNDNFELDNIEPINSGTISIILKGKLNNKPVAIKLLRNNIETDLENGLNFLKNIGYIMTFFPYINVLTPDKLFEKNREKFYEQKNFLNEIENIKLFHNTFKNKYCICPNVYSNYTNIIGDIIVMDYIEGKKICELSNEEKQMFILPLFKFLLNSLFTKKILHSDLHSGNILFITQKYNEKILYKIGIIDFGMILELSIHDCNFAYYFIDCVFNYKFIDFIEYVFEDSVYEKIFDKYDINNLMNTKNYLIQQHNNNNLFNNIKLEYVINDIYVFLSIFKERNFEFSKNIYKLLLSLIPVFSIIVGLGNENDNNIIFRNEYAKIKNDDFFDNL